MIIKTLPCPRESTETETVQQDVFLLLRDFRQMLLKNSLEAKSTKKYVKKKKKQEGKKKTGFSLLNHPCFCREEERFLLCFDHILRKAWLWCEGSSQLGVYGGQACARVLIGWQTSLTISGDAAAPQAHAFPCTESAQRAIDNEKKISKKKKKV